MLADLEGPGVVNRIWMTIADNEYGWPRLLRLRICYDSSERPSVDAPVGDFFAVGNGVEAEVELLMVRNSSDGRARNFYWPIQNWLVRRRRRLLPGRRPTAVP